MFSLPTSIHAWKNRFFFVSSSESWGFPTVWGEPDTSFNQDEPICSSDEKDFRSLCSTKLTPARDLLSPQNLRDAGLCPASVPDMQKFSADAIRAAATKRKTPEGGKRRKTVAKRPRHSGISVGAPSIATRSETAQPAPRSSPPQAGEIPASAEMAPADSLPNPNPTPAPTSGDEGSARPATTAATSSGAPSGSRFSISQERVDDGWNAFLQIGDDDSALQDSDKAYQLCQLLLLPKDAEEIGGETLDEMVGSFFTTTVMTAHLFAKARLLVHRFTKRSAAWDANKKKLEEEKRAAEAEMETVKRERDELASRERNLKEMLALRETEVQRLTTEGLGLARKLEFSAAQQQAAQQRALVNEAKARAMEAEKKKAEEGAAALAEARAKEALEEYKSSKAFLADAEFAAGDAYNLGYSDCLGKIRELFPSLDLSDASQEEAAEEAEEAEEAEGEDDEVVEVSPPLPISEINADKTVSADEATPVGAEDTPTEAVTAPEP